MKLSMCIVGCGDHARTVLRDIHDLTDEFDFYFASRDPQKARAYCDEFGGVGWFGFCVRPVGLCQHRPGAMLIPDPTAHAEARAQ